MKTDEEIEEIAIRVAEKVVEASVPRTLESLGFDILNPLETQKDVAHMRKSRKTCEMISTKTITIFLTIAVPAAVYGLWEAIKKSLTN